MMQQRPLGRTGVSVSPLALGTMMFGAWGNQDVDDSIRIIHRALDGGPGRAPARGGGAGGELEVHAPRRVGPGQSGGWR